MTSKSDYYVYCVLCLLCTMFTACTAFKCNFYHIVTVVISPKFSVTEKSNVLSRGKGGSTRMLHTNMSQNQNCPLYQFYMFY